MKNSNFLKSLLIIACCAITSIILLSFTVFTQNNDSKNIQKVTLSDATFTYSWSAEPNAINYKVALENKSTHETFSWQTTNTTITEYGIPSGNYDLTITAYFQFSSSSIVIVDDVIL